jgi:ribosomal protein S18 acetylase RimI-like enzyme
VHAWIEDVVVDGAFRRRGIGEALTRAAITRAAGLKARSVCLTSRAARDAANQLYQRMGFLKRETNLYEFKIG